MAPWAEDGRTGRPFRDVKASELAIALTARLPLSPDEATQAPSDPAIQRWQLAPLAEAEVPGPSPHKRVQIDDHLLQADAPMPPRQFANPVFEPGHGLVGDAPPEAWVILDREAEERPVPRSGDSTLLRIDLQFEAPFDEAGQARHDPSAGLFTADVMLQSSAYRTNRWLRRSSSRSSSSSTRFESKGESGSPCGVPSPLASKQPAIKHTGRQVSPDEPQNPLIRDPRRHRGHQPVVIDPVKKFGQVDIYNKPVTFDDVGLRLRHCLVSGAARPEAVAVLAECRVPLRLKSLQDRLLDHTIDHGWNAEVGVSRRPGSGFSPDAPAAAGNAPGEVDFRSQTSAL
jgi:hypothetical protein